MLEDDMYQNDGTFFQPTEPEEQLKERLATKSKVAGAKPLLREVIGHFNERIAFYGSIQSIPREVRKDPHQLAVQLEANEIAQANLSIERDWLEALLDD